MTSPGGGPAAAPRRARRGWLGCLLGVACFAGAAGAADPAPAALARAGDRAGCRIPAVAPGDPAGAWVAEREAGGAYAGWCTRQGGRLWDLVVTTVSPRHPWARCPGRIALGLDRPFPRLRATMLPRDLPYPMELGRFWYLQGDDYLTAPGPPVGTPGVPAGPALEIGEGDAGQILLCSAGRWIVGGYH